MLWVGTGYLICTSVKVHKTEFLVWSANKFNNSQLTIIYLPK